ncbi:RNA-binding protein [Paenibacillus mesophilus]|uniref:YlmH family RNA-binding protein n=1 Tax=Paenibacillus mesophilus TaxID=2582849 RepID=UPI00110D5A92|nr:YlmH/Sll1252 family protein [Paenibacillus mesophilus]TMV46646.1 RNA-binding protein [Paenibacillus mesophilus]
MATDLYSHFHPDEHRFVDKAQEWIERAARHHAVKQTDFLDPRQGFIVQSLANRYGDVQIRFDGGYERAERKRAIIAPLYRDIGSDDAGIGLLSVTSEDSRFEQLEHGDFLGALLGVGIKREKIGDIHVGDSGCHCLIASEIIDYVHLNLQQVHRVHVLTETLPLHHLQAVSQTLEEMNLSVASLRLDGIVSDVYRLSRAKVLQPIKSGRCKVNWKPEEDPSKPLREGDVVSFQGFGRFKLIEVEGETKKGRIRLKIGKFV